MVEVIFYEKPGCINNARQKRMLIAAGHSLEVKDLLQEVWERAELRRYFDSKPVVEWFNQSAPQVKSGEIVPDSVTEEEAITLMLNEPLLIRRPLMNVGNGYMSGFDVLTVDSWIGLKQVDIDVDVDVDVETCAHI